MLVSSLFIIPGIMFLHGTLSSVPNVSTASKSRDNFFYDKIQNSKTSQLLKQIH
jgi:hypothetical protein